MTKIGETESWLFAQDKLGRWLMHLPSGTVGKVAKVYSPGEFGVPSKFDPEPKGVMGMLPYEPPRVAVLAFEDGNEFVADPENFQALTEFEVLLYGKAVEKAGELMRAIGTIGASEEAKRYGSSPERVATLLRAALQTQLRALMPR